VSTDNVGVAGYGLYRDGVQQGTTTSTTAIFSGLTCNTNYTLAVDAYDSAGNRSTKGIVMVATTSCPDTTPPSAPTNLTASNVTQSGATLGWIASTDNVGVSGYDLYRGGTKVATVTSTSFVQTGLACGTSYPFGVVARDAAGNSSTQASLQVSTAACSAPPPPPPPVTSGTLLFDGGFDTGNLSQWDSSWKGANGIVPVTSDAGVSPRGGPYMAKFVVSPGDTPPWGYSDTDMVYRYNTIAGHYDVVGDDKYYGFSLYFPSGTKYQPKPGAFNYLFELHGNTDGQAPVKIGIDTNGTNTDSIKLELHVDDVSPAGAWNPALITDLGPVVFDRWIDFVVHVKWRNDSTGVLQTWVDGTKKVDQTRKTWGGNGVMTTVKPAFGMYRDDYTAPWTFYGDSYKIGTSYSTVSP